MATLPFRTPCRVGVKVMFITQLNFGVSVAFAAPGSVHCLSGCEVAIYS
jgi:hypothetical protein